MHKFHSLDCYCSHNLSFCQNNSTDLTGYSRDCTQLWKDSKGFFSFRYSIFFHFKLHNNFHFLDGLWDVLTNANVYETTKKLYDQDIEDSAEISDNLCHNLVKKLVIEARGVKSNLGFWHMSSNIDQLASGDDITCLALPIIKANIFLK